MPGKGLVPFEPWLFQQEFLLCRDRFRAINKPRQCGISTTAAAEAAWEFDNVPGAQIVIISKDAASAINFHKYIYNVLYSVRKNNPDAPRLIKTNECETTNANGARIVSLAASKEAGRSFSATHLFLDELAFIQYADDIWQAASATLAQTKGRVTAISTPKGRANLFARIFEEKNHLGFTVFQYGWWDVPTYNPYYTEMRAAKTPDERKKIIDAARGGEWYSSARAGQTDLSWRQEFEGAFDANIGSVFTERQLRKAFHRNYLTRHEDPDGVFSQWWTTMRDGEVYKDPNGLYACGIDLGRKNDPTVIITYDYKNTPAHLVDFKYIEPASAGWDEITEAILAHLRFWDAEALHDGTGAGDAVTEALDGLSEPYFFTKIGKENIVKRMQLAFDHRQVRCPKVPKLWSEHQRYQWDDKELVQDTVMANALAIWIFYEPSGGGFSYTPLHFVNEEAMAG